MEGALSRREQLGEAGPVQPGTPLGTQRTAVSSIAHVCALIGGSTPDPAGETVNAAPQETPLESQNWFNARTVNQDPLGMVPVTDVRLGTGIELPPAAAPGR